MAMRMIYPYEGMTLLHACSLTIKAIRSDIHEARSTGNLRTALGSIFKFRIAQYLGTWRGLRWRGTLTGDLRARLYYPGGPKRNTVGDPKGKPEPALRRSE
jgi:hypothetical protein